MVSSARFRFGAFTPSPVGDHHQRFIRPRIGRPYRFPAPLSAAFVAILAAISQPVHAEPSFTPGWGKQGSPQAFAMLTTYAKCVVHTERGLTAKFLAFNFPSKDRSRKAYDLVSGAGLCYDHDLKLDFQFMRGALIEALYTADILNHSGKPLLALGTSAADKNDVPPPTELARCIVRRRPDQSAAVLKAPIASPQQAQAIAALEPDLGECARETGTRPTFAELLRYQIAEELYRQAAKPQIANRVTN